MGYDTGDQAAVGTSNVQPQSKASASVIARILAAAGAKPTPVDPSGSYSGKKKRSAEGDSLKEFEPLVETVPVSAVKVKPHSSNGNIVQQYDGDSEYQNTVHSS